MEAYAILSPEEAAEYVRQALPDFFGSGPLTCKRLAGDSRSVDGHVNEITRVATSDGRSLILKQLMPHVQLASHGEFYELPLTRMAVEVHALRFWERLCPGTTPQIYHWDDAQKLLVMEDLGRLCLLSESILERRRFPEVGKQLGKFLGKTSFYTSEFFLGLEEKQQMQNTFADGQTKPFWNHLFFQSAMLTPPLEAVNPLVRGALAELCALSPVRREVERLQERYAWQRQCLIHSDLHTSNVFADERGIKVFDAEYATYGPVAFDLGRLLSSLILSYAALYVKDEVPEAEKKEYQEYLLDLIEEIYQEFGDSFQTAWEGHFGESNPFQSPYNRFYRQERLADTLGFIACASVGRLCDAGLPFDFKELTDPQVQAAGQRLVLRLAKELLLYGKKMKEISELTACLRRLAAQAD
ncbi:phosphotransferase [uncultured Anaeromusa sp.]|uniref:phosphotransferase n=1 Tax=uncultured Anaeromusa sp. TaxID=673273 RepID=UPI0029C841D8|nr:phosphotransferase [uncultured Anaeromusa sp.]